MIFPTIHDDQSYYHLLSLGKVISKQIFDSEYFVQYTDNILWIAKIFKSADSLQLYSGSNTSSNTSSCVISRGPVMCLDHSILDANVCFSASAFNSLQNKQDQITSIPLGVITFCSIPKSQIQTRSQIFSTLYLVQISFPTLKMSIVDSRCDTVGMNEKPLHIAYSPQGIAICSESGNIQIFSIVSSVAFALQTLKLVIDSKKHSIGHSKTDKLKHYIHSMKIESSFLFLLVQPVRIAEDFKTGQNSTKFKFQSNPKAYKIRNRTESGPSDYDGCNFDLGVETGAECFDLSLTENNLSNLSYQLQNQSESQNHLPRKLWILRIFFPTLSWSFTARYHLPTFSSFTVASSTDSLSGSNLFSPTISILPVSKNNSTNSFIPDVKASPIKVPISVPGYLKYGPSQMIILQNPLQQLNSSTIQTKTPILFLLYPSKPPDLYYQIISTPYTSPLIKLTLPDLDIQSQSQVSKTTEPSSDIYWKHPITSYICPIPKTSPQYPLDYPRNETNFVDTPLIHFIPFNCGTVYTLSSSPLVPKASLKFCILPRYQTVGVSPVAYTALTRSLTIFSAASFNFGNVPLDSTSTLIAPPLDKWVPFYVNISHFQQTKIFGHNSLYSFQNHFLSFKNLTLTFISKYPFTKSMASGSLGGFMSEQTQNIKNETSKDIEQQQITCTFSCFGSFDFLVPNRISHYASSSTTDSDSLATPSFAGIKDDKLYYIFTTPKSSESQFSLLSSSILLQWSKNSKYPSEMQLCNSGILLYFTLPDSRFKKIILFDWKKVFSPISVSTPSVKQPNTTPLPRSGGNVAVSTFNGEIYPFEHNEVLFHINIHGIRFSVKTALTLLSKTGLKPPKESQEYFLFPGNISLGKIPPSSISANDSHLIIVFPKVISVFALDNPSSMQSVHINHAFDININSIVSYSDQTGSSQQPIFHSTQFENFEEPYYSGRFLAVESIHDQIFVTSSEIDTTQTSSNPFKSHDFSQKDPQDSVITMVGKVFSLDINNQSLILFWDFFHSPPKFSKCRDSLFCFSTESFICLYSEFVPEFRSLQFPIVYHPPEPILAVCSSNFYSHCFLFESGLYSTKFSFSPGYYISRSISLKPLNIWNLSNNTSNLRFWFSANSTFTYLAYGYKYPGTSISGLKSQHHSIDPDSQTFELIFLKTIPKSLQKPSVVIGKTKVSGHILDISIHPQTSLLALSTISSKTDPNNNVSESRSGRSVKSGRSAPNKKTSKDLLFQLSASLSGVGIGGLGPSQTSKLKSGNKIPDADYSGYIRFISPNSNYVQGQAVESVPAQRNNVISESFVFTCPEYTIYPSLGWFPDVQSDHSLSNTIFKLVCHSWKFEPVDSSHLHTHIGYSIHSLLGFTLKVTLNPKTSTNDTPLVKVQSFKQIAIHSLFECSDSVFPSFSSTLALTPAPPIESTPHLPIILFSFLSAPKSFTLFYWWRDPSTNTQKTGTYAQNESLPIFIPIRAQTTLPELVLVPESLSSSSSNPSDSNLNETQPNRDPISFLVSQSIREWDINSINFQHSYKGDISYSYSQSAPIFNVGTAHTVILPVHRQIDQVPQMFPLHSMSSKKPTHNVDLFLWAGVVDKTTLVGAIIVAVADFRKIKVKDPATYSLDFHKIHRSGFFSIPFTFTFGSPIISIHCPDGYLSCVPIDNVDSLKKQFGHKHHSLSITTKSGRSTQISLIIDSQQQFATQLYQNTHSQSYIDVSTNNNIFPSLWNVITTSQIKKIQTIQKLSIKNIQDADMGLPNVMLDDPIGLLLGLEKDTLDGVGANYANIPKQSTPLPLENISGGEVDISHLFAFE